MNYMELGVADVSRRMKSGGCGFDASMTQFRIGDATLEVMPGMASGDLLRRCG